MFTAYLVVLAAGLSLFITVGLTHLGRYATSRSPSWARAGGWRQTIYSYSLPILMGTVWLLSSFG